MDSLELLNRYASVTQKIKEVVYQTNKGNVHQELTEIIERLETDVNRVIQSLHEEALVEFAAFDETLNTVVVKPEEVKEQISYRKEESGVLVLEFPIWLLLSRSKNWNIRPTHRGGVSFVRATQFWGALIRHLIPMEDGYYGSLARPVDNPSHMATVDVVFHRYSRILPDWDKLDLTYFINALVYNGVIPGDHPSALKLTFSYITVVSKEEERVEIRIKNR